MRQKFWTPEKQTEFCSLKEAGKTKEELAAHFGVTVNAINGQLFRQGFTKPNKRRAQKAIAPVDEKV